MARIFAYIVHKGGVADDSAAELAAAARKIDAAASPTAIVTGWGAELDAVCETLRASYAEVWKIANEALAYPNAELVRKALVKRAAARQHRAGSARPFRNRSVAGSFHQDELGFCLRRGGHRRGRRQLTSKWSARSSADR